MKPILPFSDTWRIRTAKVAEFSPHAASATDGGAQPDEHANPHAGDWDERLYRGDRNSFDVTRLVLASLVVLEHSYFLIDGTAVSDPISILSRGQTNSGELAVFMFFSLSGFLVTDSLVRSSSIRKFMAKRVARIFPAFLAAAALTCLVVGPLTASSSLSQYFHAQNWRAIIIDTVMLKPYPVVDVLQGNQLQLVHGTIWTIQYEFDCYLVLAMLGALGLTRSRLAIPIYAGLAIALAVAMATDLPRVDHGILALIISSPSGWPVLFPFFLVGSAFYLFRKSIPKSGVLLVAAMAATAVSFIVGGAYWALLFGGTYIVLFSSLSFGAQINLFGRRVDLSYGVYLYGWPIQQMLLFYSGMKLLPPQLFVSAIITSYVVAWVSWTVLEQPCLALLRHRRS